MRVAGTVMALPDVPGSVTGHLARSTWILSEHSERSSVRRQTLAL